MKILSFFKVTFVFVVLIILSSCSGSGGSFLSRSSKSDKTGWNYNDKNMGSFFTARNKEQKTGPGLVFVQGGTFIMGQTNEDVMGFFNNIPRRVSLPGFYMDQTEVSNLNYREYLNWLCRVFDVSDPQYAKMYAKALPDTLCWRSALAYNEPMVEYYFRHPAYNNYPVVGISWQQAYDYCLWRTDRVNEGLLIKDGYVNKKSITGQQGENNFNTKSYLLGLYQAPPGPNSKKKSNPLKNANGTARTTVNFSDGILQPNYRLPTEAEWEYAAYGGINQNPLPSLKEGQRGEELILNRQVYPWKENVNSLRYFKKGKQQGEFLANFRRNAGDYAGVAGGLNDRAIFTSQVDSYLPNGYGLYNMAGNVAEWVSDVYRPLTTLDAEDVAPYRGNVFKQLYTNDNGEPEIDEFGKVKTINQKDADARTRYNYSKADERDYLDGDSSSNVNYGYGVTTLIGNKSRVYKGGSWQDLPYWISPGTRRFLDEDRSSSTIGFRCAMDRMGSPEGNGRQTGNWFKSRRQKR